jgi:hypothetical protein
VVDTTGGGGFMNNWNVTFNQAPSPPPIPATPISIPEWGVATPYPSPLLVTAEGNIHRMTVTLIGVAHVYLEDLDVILESNVGCMSTLI